MTQASVTWITFAVAFAVINLVSKIWWQRRKRKLSQDPERRHPPNELDAVKQAEQPGNCWICKKTTQSIARLRMRRLHGFFDRADVVDVSIGCCPDCYQEYRRQRRRQYWNVLLIMAALPIVPVVCGCSGGEAEITWQFVLVMYCISLVGCLPFAVIFSLLYMQYRRPPMQKILRSHLMVKQLLERYYRDMNFKLAPNVVSGVDNQKM